MITIDLDKLFQKMKLVRRIIDCGPDRKDPKKTAGAYIAISIMYDVILDLVEEWAENGKDD